MGDRVEPPFVSGERAMLEAWLEFHRATLVLKCDGLDAEDLRARPIPTSLLSLHGLVRHMAEVERNWFQRVLAGREAPPIWWTEDDPDGDLRIPGTASFDDDVLVWRAEVAESRTVGSERDLDATGIRHGQPCSLRWILVHMIEEYARHNGHADLIRELLDGAVGE